MPDQRPFDELEALLVLPDRLVCPVIGWSQVESGLGVALPEDYKQLIDRYGAGSVADFIHVFHPTTALKGFLLGADGHLQDLRDYGAGDYPYPLWPKPGGLLPVARTLGGDHCYWRVNDADPNGWTVVTTESLYDWWEHPGGIVAFLADVFTGRARYPVFPDDWPKPSYKWVPYPVNAPPG